MLASIRAAAPRALPRFAPVQARSIVSKSERWTPASIREGKQVLENPSGLELSKVLPNIESTWNKLARDEQYAVYRQLEEVQRKDWKELTVDEKKGAYFVAYGPHGPRKDVSPPGQNGKVIIGIITMIGVGLAGFFGVRKTLGSDARTMTREYQEQSNKRLRELNQNPISGLSSEGYKGKGLVSV